MTRKLAGSLLYLILICTAWLVVVFPAGISGSLLGQVAGDNLDLVGNTVSRLAALVTVLLVTHLFVRRTLNMGLGELGLALTNRTGLLLGTGTVIGAVGLTAVFLLCLSLGHLVVLGFCWHHVPPVEFLAAIYRGVLVCIVVAVTEEVIFRGYFLQSLSRTFSFPLAVVLTSLLFALLHFGGPAASSVQPMLLFGGLFSAGLILAAAYYISQSLWLPIGIHFAWNLTEKILGITGQTGETAVLLVTRVDGPTWLVGSAYGTEGAVFGYLGMGLMAVLLYLLRHKLKAPPLRARISSVR
ncbi:MAG: CPBP family intramembrane metalloprotease [Desulforudis sp.]|nr:MAG: CPBP family intramembrane metalloprotease [Desulforudis sp.]